MLLRFALTGMSPYARNRSPELDSIFQDIIIPALLPFIEAEFTSKTHSKCQTPKFLIQRWIQTWPFVTDDQQHLSAIDDQQHLSAIDNQQHPSAIDDQQHPSAITSNRLVSSCRTLFLLVVTHKNGGEGETERRRKRSGNNFSLNRNMQIFATGRCSKRRRKRKHKLSLNNKTSFASFRSIRKSVYLIFARNCNSWICVSLIIYIELQMNLRH